MVDLFAEAKVNGFSAKSKAGWRFSRDKTAQKEYKQLKGPLLRSKQEAFKKTWADSKHKMLIESKEHTEGFTKINAKSGKHRAPEWVLKQEGGRDCPAAVKSTAFFIKKMLLLGPPFVKFNTDFNRLDLLVVTEEYKEEFKETWEKKVKSFTESAALGAIDADGKTTKTRISTKGQGNKNITKINVATSTPNKKPKVENPLVLAEKTKALYMKTMSAGDNIVARPDSNVTWAWAKDSPHFKQLQSLVTHIKANVQGSEFFHEFLTSDARSLKKTATDDGEWNRNLHCFVDTFADDLQSLEKLNKCVLGAHELFAGVS